MQGRGYGGDVGTVKDQTDTHELVVKLENERAEYWIIREKRINGTGGHNVAHLGGKAYVQGHWKRFKKR